MKRLLIGLALLFVTGLAAAADRHVYLDTDGDGKLNDCGNPAHNVKGTSNTDALKRCTDVTPNKFYCTGGGCQAWTRDCLIGSRADVVNGDTVDVDGDGVGEKVYATPQACIYNAAPSDSCEIHAGTYKLAGAICESDCGKWAGLSTCEDGDCWQASVFISGEGPNKTRTAAFGTANAPFYLRGAEMNSSTDTWDSNGNKTPDTVGGEPTSYPAILSGDANANGTLFEPTDCAAGACTGDSFYQVIVGCGSPDQSYGNYLCQKTASKTAGTHDPFVDTDGNGTFDTELGTNGVGNVDYVVIKDLEFKNYNGGATAAKVATQGPRYWAGNISLGGDGDMEGFKVQHIYEHANDYSTKTGEYDWATFADSSNSSCGTQGTPGQTIVEDSYLEQNNEKLYNSDTGLGDPGGCPPVFRNNRVLINITSTRQRPDFMKAFYFKPFETPYLGLPKRYTVYNNDFAFRAGTGWALFDLGGFANGDQDGVLDFHGNIVRHELGYTGNVSGLWDNFTLAAAGGKFKLYSNTFDLDSRAEIQLTVGAPAMYDTNNIRLGLTGIYQSTAQDLRRGWDMPCDVTFPGSCTSATTPASVSTRGTTFTSATLVGVNAADPAYKIVAGNSLIGKGTCDPDEDGVAGVDYDGDGVNDTTWTDIFGATITCANLMTDRINIGADQNAAAVIAVCGDASCDAAVGETVCTCPADCGAPPATETVCTDGLDDDCDLAVDCADPDCSATCFVQQPGRQVILPRSGTGVGKHGLVTFFRFDSRDWNDGNSVCASMSLSCTRVWRLGATHNLSNSLMGCNVSLAGPLPPTPDHEFEVGCYNP